MKRSVVRAAAAIVMLLAACSVLCGAATTRNVILMIGDGMSYAHVTAGSYYLNGAVGTLSFEPYHKCPATTYCLDSAAHPVTDSAAAASALATGHKVNYVTVSQSPTGVPYTSIVEHAKKLGKRTGIIGTDPITRATPGAFVSHDASRYNYIAMGDDLLNSSLPDVAMGGGATPAGGSEYFSTAQVNKALALGYQVAYTKDQMLAIDNAGERVLGLFTALDMTYEYDRPANTTEPHLSEMTAKALALLDTDPDGFFLMVEGAKIDYGAHANDIARTVGEVVEFNNAFQVVQNWLQGRTDTLVIVTGDHETGGLTATNRGAGVLPGATWTSTDHTNANVPIYALGPGSEMVQEYVSGGVADNTNIFDVMYRAFTGAPRDRTPYPIYKEQSPLEGGNVYYAGGVFDGTLFSGQIVQCAQQWGDEQVDGTALLNMTAPQQPAGRPIAKCSAPLGGYIYIGGSTGLFRAPGWEGPVSQIPVPDGVVPESICTDGTYLYMTSASSSSYHKLFKFAVNHATAELAVEPGWPVAIGTASSTRFRGLSCYGGKLYAANHLGSGSQIYEIDTTTRGGAQLSKVPALGANANNGYQCVRFGDELFVVGLDDCLHTYQLSGTTWTLNASVNLGLGDLYGLAVKGNAGRADYAWVTSIGSTVSFYGFAPWAEPPAALGSSNAGRNNYPVAVADAVVTKSDSGGFWIEDKSRAAGAHVLWSGSVPAPGATVSLADFVGGRSESGEKTLSPATGKTGSVAEGGPWDMRPLRLRSDSIGMASDSAGLATDGLLVTVCGVVRHCDDAGEAIYLDDGAGVESDVSGVAGLKVLMSGPGTPPLWSLIYPELSPCFALVTGIARLEKLPDGRIIRRVDARSNSDVIVTPL